MFSPTSTLTIAGVVMVTAHLLSAQPFRIEMVRDGGSSYEGDSWDLEPQALALGNYEDSERPVRTSSYLF